MFGSVYFGQMYFAGAVFVPVIPPVPPTPGEGSAGGGGGRLSREHQGERHAPAMVHRHIHILGTDSPVRKLRGLARHRYAEEHPAPTKIKTLGSVGVVIKQAEQKKVEKKVCCKVLAVFLIPSNTIDAKIIQVINSRAMFISNNHFAEATVISDASYSNGLTDEETIALLQLV